MKFFLRSVVLLVGLSLNLISLLIISIEFTKQSHSHIFYLILPVSGGFILKILSIFFLYKNTKIQSNCVIFSAQLTEFISRLAFLSVEICITVNIDWWVLTGVLPIIFKHFLLLQDYSQKKLCKDFKIQIYAKNNKVVLFGSIFFECLTLATVLIYTIARSTLTNIISIVFHINAVVLIFYITLLRIENACVVKKKKTLQTTPANSESKLFQNNLGTENQTLNVNTVIDEFDMKNGENYKIYDNTIEKNEYLINNKKSSFFQQLENRISAQKYRSLSFDTKINTNTLKIDPSPKDAYKFKKKKNQCILHSIGSDLSASFHSNKTIKIEKNESVKELWEYLPTIFEEGIAIFEENRIAKFNTAFSNFIAIMMNQEITQENLTSEWDNIFEKIKVDYEDSESSSSNNMLDLNLKKELLKIISLRLQDLSTEIRMNYIVQQNNLTFYLSIFKKITISNKNFVIIKIGDHSNEYRKLSRKASKIVKKQFRLSLAHEAKTPLNYLISTIKLIKNEASTSSYNQLKNSAKIFQLVLNGILKIAFVEDPKHIECFPEQFSIFDALQKIINSVKILFQNRGLELILKSDVENIENFIFHDKIIIETIIYQFLSNSLKYTKEGTVTVQLLYNTSKEDFQISFADTGIGLTDEEADNLKIFLDSDINTNVQISKHSTGANMGLNTCKSLLSCIHKADDNKIRLLFESKHKVFSNFTVVISKQYYDEKNVLPSFQNIKTSPIINSMTSINDRIICEEKSASDLDLQSVGSENKLPEFYSTIKNVSSWKFLNTLNNRQNLIKNACKCPFRILVVDDEEFNLISFDQMCSLVLKNSLNKYELLVGHDGQEGLAVFTDYFKRKRCKSQLCCPIKLVVLDYNMPGFTGPEIASKMVDYLLKNSKKDYVKICGWTAYVGMEYKNNFTAAGATSILSKPIKVKELSQLLSELLISQIYKNKISVLMNFNSFFYYRILSKTLMLTYF